MFYLKKHYHITKLGHRLLLDWRNKRLQRLEKQLERQANNDITGKKLDYFCGLILVWVLFFLFFNNYFSVAITFILAMTGPILFSRIYNNEKLKKQHLINKMKKERERKNIFLQNIQSLNQQEINNLLMEIGEALGLTKLKVIEEGLAAIFTKGEKRVSLYLCRAEENPVTMGQIEQFIHLLKEQHAHAGVFITDSYFDKEAFEHVEKVSPVKVKLIERTKLMELLKHMEHPIYSTSNLYQEKRIEAVHHNKHMDKKTKLTSLFTEKPDLVGKYLIIATVLTTLSLLMSSGLKVFYLLLAMVNVILAAYTYYGHLPMPEEEIGLMLDDLV